jgi:hypothetical protein
MATFGATGPFAAGFAPIGAAHTAGIGKLHSNDC